MTRGVNGRTARAATALALLLPAAAAACAGPRGEPEAISLLGNRLWAAEVPGERGTELREALAASEAHLAEHPEEEGAWILVGRRQAYLGHYRDAVATWTAALERFPDSPRLLRHRGHRWITLRRFDRAIEDLGRAAELIAGRTDEVEPDAAPASTDSTGAPRSTLHSNVWYHLGLAHWLEEDAERAAQAWRRCLVPSAVNDDMYCATSYWLALALMRLGRDEELAAVLAPIREDMDVRENHAYHELLLLLRGDRTPEEVLGGAADDESLPGLELATRGYGVAAWHLAHGRPEEARPLLARIVAETAWPAFGHIAAEVELASESSSPECASAESAGP